MAEQRVQRRLAAILVADVVGYSRLIEADEEGTRARLMAVHDEIIDPRIASDGGRIVKTTGDGVLVEFPSAVDAVRNAIQIQEAMERHNADVTVESRITFRVGINVGDVIVEGDDIHGDAVNVASRLEGLCGTGEIYVSGTVFDQAAGKLAASFEDLGEQIVKNIAKPVRVYRASPAPAEPGKSGDPSKPLPVPEKPSIAVLPFANLSGDVEQEYFADGISEDIITALSRIRWFFVIARNTTFTYKGQSVDIQRVARDLGVRYVLEGSVRKSGTRVRITGQLIDGETGNHIWADKYDRDLEDVFAVQDEITENIVGALEPQIVVAEHIRSQQKTEQNLDSWDLVLRAMARISEFSQNGTKDALDLLDRAIEIDPTYARAYSHKAWTLVWRALQGWEEMESVLPVAIGAGEKAIQYDREEPWAYIGWVFISIANRDFEKMASSARTAIELNPNFALAHSHFGLSHAFVGRGAESFEWIEKARRLSPRDMFQGEFDLHTSFACFQVADYQQAAAFAAKSSMPRPEHLYPHLLIAASQGHLSAEGPARDEVAKIMAIVPGYSLAIADKVCVYQNDDDRARFLDGLRKAGLPE